MSSGGKQRRSRFLVRSLDAITNTISDAVGLNKKKMFSVSTRQRVVARRRTALAIYILFGNLRGRESRVRSVTAEDVAAVNDFIRKAGRGPVAFGFSSAEQLHEFRDALLSVRRAVSASRLGEAESGRLAAKLVGPVVEKFAFLHPAFRQQLLELASIHVDIVNKQRANGLTFYDGTGKEIGRPPRLNKRLIFLATNVRLVQKDGSIKEFTDFLMLAFPGDPATFVLKDYLKASIGVSNENKAPSVVSESNYQHANSAGRLADAREVLYMIDGKEYRARPSDFFTSQAAIQEVTMSVKGRFGGSTRMYASNTPEDWLHSMRTHVPADARSAQLRVVLSLRKEALLQLVR